MNKTITNPILPVYIVLPVMAVLFIGFLFLIARRRSGWKDQVFTGLRIFAILALAFMINLRVMVGNGETLMQLKNVDLLFVVDTTISMWAQDYNGKRERMEGVLSDCDYIINELAGSNFGLIRFDNRSQVLAPFTQDASNVRDAFSTIKSPDRNYAKGSSLNVPYDDMEDMFVSSSKKEDRKTYLFFISDGEITDGSALESYAELKGFLDGGAVLGYGTAAGGKMRESSYSSYLKDPETGQDAVSVMDETSLRQIASDLGLEYIHMESRANVEYLVAAIKGSASDIVGEGKSVNYEDTYYYYAYPLLVLLLLELVLFIRRGRL